MFNNLEEVILLFHSSEIDTRGCFPAGSCEREMARAIERGTLRRWILLGFSGVSEEEKLRAHGAELPSAGAGAELPALRA